MKTKKWILPVCIVAGVILFLVLAFFASCRQGVFFIPLIFILPHLFLLDGILMTQSAADILTFLVSIPFHIVFVKKHLKSDEATPHT